MSMLLDKQVNALKEFENKTGVHTRFRRPTKKCAMKMNVELEKTMCTWKCFWWKEAVYKPAYKAYITGENNLNELLG